MASLPEFDEAPKTMVLIHPRTLEPMGDDKTGFASISLHSPSSEVMQKHDRLAQQRMSKQLMAGRKMRDLPGEFLVDQTTARYVAHIATWDNLDVGTKGTPLPCTAENKVMLVTNPKYGWIRTQIDEFLANEGNFLS